MRLFEVVASILILTVASLFLLNPKNVEGRQSAALLDDTCYQCMQKQQASDAVFQTLWQLHIEKVWCLRHLISTNESFDECLALDVHVSEEIERMYGGIARRVYLREAKAYLMLLQRLGSFGNGGDIKGKAAARTAADDAGANLALILHELNPRAIPRGNMRTTYQQEVAFAADPTAVNFMSARDAVMRRGSMLSHMHAFYA